ncbi:MAG TPA: DUF6456 domain-containing protein [Hyphomonadaceae bacterium]|nr:DUF6456 domain-containing protein [Hyphomonadaceae bacterium]
MNGALRQSPPAAATPSNPSNFPDASNSPNSSNPKNFSVVPNSDPDRSQASAVSDLESLVRILRVSGRRLVECDGEWRVLPGGDRRRRTLMVLDTACVGRLLSEKLIVASTNGYVLADSEAPSGERPAAGPWIFQAACVPDGKGRWKGFARLAEMARHGRGPLSLRQALAGLRLIEDAEIAARDSLLTMNWDAVPSDRNARSGGNGGLQPHARLAAQRIACIRAALGKRDFTIVYAACVDRVNLKALETRFGLKRLEARRLLPEALETVAEVYDARSVYGGAEGLNRFQAC